ncbi:hypothetical protein [Pseudoduganella sp. HUAS MS19]
MIIPHPGISNIWYRCAILWFAAWAVVGIDLTIINAYERLNNFDALMFITVWLLAPVMLGAIGHITGGCNRVITCAFVFGLFGAIPSLLMVTLSSGLFFLIARPDLITATFFAFVSLLITATATTNFLRFRRALRAAKFVEREFEVSHFGVFVNRGVLLAENADGSRFDGALLSIVPSLATGVYFFQAGLAGQVEDATLILLVSLSVMPIAVHGFSQFIGGFYLWIYLTWKFERQHNLKVRFKDSVEEQHS